MAKQPPSLISVALLKDHEHEGIIRLKGSFIEVTPEQALFLASHEVVARDVVNQIPTAPEQSEA